jgi:hypothetical protein
LQAFGSSALTEDEDGWASKDMSWGYKEREMVNPKSGEDWGGPWGIDFEVGGDEDGWQ